jgi:hypothetical protein
MLQSPRLGRGRPTGRQRREVTPHTSRRDPGDVSPATLLPFAQPPSRAQALPRPLADGHDCELSDLAIQGELVQAVAAIRNTTAPVLLRHAVDEMRNTYRDAGQRWY